MVVEGAKIPAAGAGNIYRKRYCSYLEISLVEPVSFVVGIIFEVDGAVRQAQVFEEPGEKFLGNKFSHCLSSSFKVFIDSLLLSAHISSRDYAYFVSPNSKNHK